MCHAARHTQRSTHWAANAKLHTLHYTRSTAQAAQHTQQSTLSTAHATCNTAACEEHEPTRRETRDGRLVMQGCLGGTRSDALALSKPHIGRGWGLVSRIDRIWVCVETQTKAARNPGAPPNSERTRLLCTVHVGHTQAGHAILGCSFLPNHPSGEDGAWCHG